MPKTGLDVRTEANGAEPNRTEPPRTVRNQPWYTGPCRMVDSTAPAAAAALAAAMATRVLRLLGAEARPG